MFNISQVLKQFMLNIIKGCQTSGFLGSIAALSQIWSIAAVAFDRFKGIHYPLDAQKRTTNAQVFLVSLVCLFLALVFILKGIFNAVKIIIYSKLFLSFIIINRPISYYCSFGYPPSYYQYFRWLDGVNMCPRYEIDYRTICIPYKL